MQVVDAIPASFAVKQMISEVILKPCDAVAIAETEMYIYKVREPGGSPPHVSFGSHDQ